MKHPSFGRNSLPLLVDQTTATITKDSATDLLLLAAISGILFSFIRDCIYFVSCQVIYYPTVPPQAKKAIEDTNPAR